MTTSKPGRSDGATLPEWPDKLSRAPLVIEEFTYYRDTAEAALARMEALVEYLGTLGMRAHLPVCNYPHDFPCCCGLDELLAACARKEAGK